MRGEFPNYPIAMDYLANHTISPLKRRSVPQVKEGCGRGRGAPNRVNSTGMQAFQWN